MRCTHCNTNNVRCQAQPQSGRITHGLFIRSVSSAFSKKAARGHFNSLHVSPLASWSGCKNKYLPPTRHTVTDRLFVCCHSVSALPTRDRRSSTHTYTHTPTYSTGYKGMQHSPSPTWWGIKVFCRLMKDVSIIKGAIWKIWSHHVSVWQPGNEI